LDDVLSFRLKGTHVYLNTCESGNGPVNEGEGLLSFGLLFGILDQIFGWEIDWENSIAIQLMDIPLGVFCCYILYIILKKKWESEYIALDTIDDIGVMNSLPGITIYSPADSIETRLALDLSLSIKTPKYFRLGKSGEPYIFTSTQSNFPDWTPLADGERLLLLTTGAVTGEALKAVEILRASGISISLCAIPVLKPFQFNKIYVQNFKHVLVVEEHSISGGLGSLVSEQIALSGISVNLVKLGLPDLVHHEIGSQKYLRSFFNIDAEGIVSKVREMLKI
jgi:hypothetical protein